MLPITGVADFDQGDLVGVAHACIDRFGAAVEQEQLDGSIKPARVSFEYARLGKARDTSLLGGRQHRLALKRLRGYLWVTIFRIFSDHQALKSIGRAGTIKPESSRGLIISPRSSKHSITAKET